MATTLVVTNDFPPRIGGIEGFVSDICHDLAGDVVVLTSSQPRDRLRERLHDAALPFPVHRLGFPLLPTPGVRRAAVALMRAHGCSRVLFGAAAPLGLLGSALRRAGAERMVALSHGHEVWWANTPARPALIRIVDNVDHMTTISSFTHRHIERALPDRLRSRLTRLEPGVDTSLFRPAGAPEPVVLCPGRMVAQKNHAGALEAWRRMRVPESELWLVGEGPQQQRLMGQAERLPGAASVRFLGPVPREEMPALMQRASVVLLPVRHRWAGLNAEGWGVVFAEAAASGVPAIGGASGGVGDVIQDGRTGFLVEPHDHVGMAGLVTALLTDESLRRGMAEAARRYAVNRWGDGHRGARIRQLLGLSAPQDR